MELNFLINTIREGAGIPNRAVYSASGLDMLGESVSILTLETADRSLSDSIVIEKPIFFGKRFPFRALRSEFFPLTYLAKTQIAKSLKKLKPDVVLVDYTPLDKFANSLKHKLGYKVIYNYHGVADPDMYEGSEKKRRIAEKESILCEVQKADLVVAISNYAKNELAEYGIDSTVIYNGVDLDVFKPNCHFKNFKKTAPALVYVGRYTEHKGVLDLLKAFKKAKEQIKDLVLYMVGNKDNTQYVNMLKNFIRESNIEDSVMMFDSVHDDILPYLYCSGDLFVSGTYHELFGMTFIEAAACGLPSVAFNIKSLPEVIKHEETGLLVEQGDVNSFAQAIVTLISDKSKMEQYSQNSLEFAEQFDWKIIAKKIQSVAVSLLDK